MRNPARYLWQAAAGIALALSWALWEWLAVVLPG
jgi:hypothetical protein